MSERRILVADADPQAGEAFRQALGEGWEIVAATSGTTAMEEMARYRCSVVVADLNLPEVDGAELLSQIRQKYPRMVRLLAAADDDKEQVMRNVRGAHQFLTKPYDGAALKEVIERALATEVWVANDTMRELIARVRTLPTVPALYLEVVTALRSPDATTRQVGEIIAKDMAMMTKLLQVLNSACFGLTRQISDPAEAVGILGFESVKAMVATIKLLNQYDKLESQVVSVEKLWQHSTDVARTARQLALAETGDRELADLAFTGGLMHDLGKVVLAANFDDQYYDALLMGARNGVPAWDVEQDVFGVNHGEVGAYLLGLWGLPLPVLEAAALHHSPSRSANQGFTALTAVHVANVLEREVNADVLGMPTAKLDDEYLEEAGLLWRVDAWRQAVSKRDFTRLAPRAKGGTGLAMRATLIDPHSWCKTPELPSRKSPILEPVSRSRKWLYGGVVALAGLALLAGTGMILKLRAKQLDKPAGGDLEKVEPMPRNIQPRPAVPPQVNKQLAGPPGEGVQPATPTNGSETIIGPLHARARTETPTTPGGKELPLAEFKLQGIAFNGGSSSAIINGENVRLYEKIFGAWVVEITATNVTIESQGERRTLTLPAK